MVIDKGKKYIVDKKGIRHQVPIMGGCKQLPDEQWIVWSGGVPNADWSGLKNPDPDAVRPTQFRPEGISTSIKTRYYRVLGLSTKFTQESDLLTFQQEVHEHLEEYGMDTIAYLPNPDDSGEMIYVVNNHARFTTREAEQAEKAQQKKYDAFDLVNSMDAKKFLFQSVDESFGISRISRTRSILRFNWARSLIALFHCAFKPSSGRASSSVTGRYFS